MAYTSHGHHVKGTDIKYAPITRARCGGPAICSLCSREAAAAQIAEETRVRLVAPYPCRFDGVMVSWKESQGWKGEDESYRNHCTDPGGHLPRPEYLE